jgi:hypothetical protein
MVNLRAVTQHWHGTSASVSITTSFSVELSLPCILETPMNACSTYDPAELIIDYANQPSPLLTSFLPGNDSDDEQSWPMEKYARGGLARLPLPSPRRALRR